MTEEKQVPIPQGKYVPAVRVHHMVYTAGMTPRQAGKLVSTETILEEKDTAYYKEIVELAASNALRAVYAQLETGEQIQQIVSITVYVRAEANFTKHSKIADLASDWLYRELGEKGIGCRAAVGVASLPGNAPVEIQLSAAVG